MIHVLIKNWLWFVSCFAIYFVYGCLVYFEPIKRSPHYLYIGLTIALIGNLTWLFCAKRPESATEILYVGLVWDLVIMLSFMAASFAFNAVHFNIRTAIGIALLLAGSILLKL